MSETIETLGKLISEAEKRDAIHVAVEPAVAAHTLRPGEHVGFVDDGFGVCEKPLGIVDPFLAVAVQKGQRFWLFIYPRKITSLRHVWAHPDFPDAGYIPKSSAESEAWLRNFIENADCPDYDTVIAVASGAQLPSVDPNYYGSHYVDTEYLHFEGRDAHGDIPPEFWDHLEIVTGKKITTRAKYFSCSC